MESAAYKLWKFFKDEHELILLGGQLNDIVSEVNAYERIVNNNKLHVSNLQKPFDESLILLRNLADLQNGAPLEQHRKEWEETMEQVYDFLNRWENGGN